MLLHKSLCSDTRGTTNRSAIEGDYTIESELPIDVNVLLAVLFFRFQLCTLLLCNKECYTLSRCPFSIRALMLPCAPVVAMRKWNKLINGGSIHPSS